MLAVMKKLKYDEEYNFENEVSGDAAPCWPWCRAPLTPSAP